MSQTAIPLEFEQYLQNKVSLKQPTELNEIIFAMIPDLDLSQPIDRTASLPPLEQWVFQQDVDQIGKSGSNSVVYSVVISGSTAPFTFNAMYLRDKNVPNSCGMVVYKATEIKETGMALTKSLLMQFDGAAAAANVTIDAATWQIDYQARLKGMDEDHRLSCLDNYGHTAFVDGFEVTRHEFDQTKYMIAPGVAYVGGLRIQNALSTVQTVDSKPTTLWVDVYRDGTALSKHENLFQIVSTTDDLVDYTDSENRPHYVAKVARIEADGSIVDLRVKGGLAKHVADSDPHPQYVKESRQSVRNLFWENQNFNVPGKDGTLTEVEQTFTVGQEFSKGWFVKSGTLIASLSDGRLIRNGHSTAVIARKYKKNKSGLPKASDLIASIEGKDGLRRYSTDVGEITIREDSTHVWMDINTQPTYYDIGAPCLSHQKAPPLPLSDADSAKSNIVPLITTEEGWGNGVLLDWSNTGYKTSDLKGLLIVAKVLTGTVTMKGEYSQFHPSSRATGNRLFGIVMNDPEPLSNYTVMGGLEEVTDTTAKTFLFNVGYTGAVFGVYGVL
ncbi:phage tail protein [Vibrio neptunius]|uniref:phage tail protein n=1 Tax=Vibrio neptunius TaxID=170651 RepID=UPI00214F4403|nr:phage tail protein [Vibrio neptunius]